MREISNETSAWRTLQLRLIWAYGEARASRMLDHEDEPTEADLASWRRLITAEARWPRRSPRP